jgi:hypothetical protein
MARVSKNRSRFIRHSSLNKRRGFSLNDFSLNNRTIVNTISQSGSKKLFHVGYKREIVRSSFKPIEFVSTSAVCRARRIRREVLFARGKSGGNHKPPTFSLKSLIRCV